MASFLLSLESNLDFFGRIPGLGPGMGTLSLWAAGGRLHVGAAGPGRAAGRLGVQAGAGG